LFTIATAAVGPHGGTLFRLTGTVNGKPVSCLIDCGATNDFVSLAFVQRHKLEQRLTATDRRVRGYDGQVTPAAGVLPTLLNLSGLPGVPLPERQLLVTQLHSDDIILGLPWLADTHALIDFAARSLTVEIAGGKHELPLAEGPRAPAMRSETAALIDSILALYTDDGEEADPAHNGMLSSALRGGALSLAQLQLMDDRGSQGPRVAATAPLPRCPPSDPGLDALRKKLLAEFADTFPAELPVGEPPGRGHELHIELYDGARPPSFQPPRINAKHAAFEAKWLEGMLAKELIRPSQSEYAAPHFYVDKPETPTTGEYRAVTDFRRLNERTVKNRYPLPRADQLFDRLAHAKYFSKIDLRTGFYQILIAEADRHKTAFTTSKGLFEYNVLPMGLCNSPGVFMALMNDTFREYLDKFVLVFLDDIIVYSDTLEDHERHLRLALQRLRQQRLYAKLSKSELCQTEVEFLGHHVGRAGLRVMEDKIEAVRDWPVPATLRELRAFLGLAGYYRRFVKGFSEIALPLTELTRNVTHQRLQWGTKQQLAFVELKQALQSTPVLALPDPKLPFVVHCDASGYAVGAVLQQDRGAGLQPIAFLSRKLSGAETRYPVHEQELLAIITALTTWRHYLSGTDTPVRVRTDHKSLIHFQTQPMLSGRQTRWLETLANFDYVVEYVAGSANGVADALSRRHDLNAPHMKEDRPLAFVDSKRTFELNRIMVERSTELDSELRAVSTEQRNAGRQRNSQRAAGADRQHELDCIAARARANEAATTVVPEAAIDPARPRPDVRGSRVTPTQRCTANNRRGTHCGSRTAKGRYCFAHMRSESGLRVKRSTIPLAGMGLFAERDFARGDHIADYTGDQLIIRRDGDGGPYCLALTQREAIDAARTNSGYGRWANDPRDPGRGGEQQRRRPNAEFVLNPASRTGRLRATRAIRAGDEVFVSYGAQYWRTFGAHARVVARPAAAAAAVAPAGWREVIDLTATETAAGWTFQRRHPMVELTELDTSTACTFSSALTDEFDRACKADSSYAARVAQGDAQPADELADSEYAAKAKRGQTSKDEQVLRDGRLFMRCSGAMRVPDDAALRTRLVRECHDSATSGHLGRDKTVEQMKRRFFWHGMDKFVSEYVTTCDACQKNKPSQRRTPGELMPIASPAYAGHTWTMDLITQLPKTRGGNDAIVVWVCKFSKLRHYAACRTAIDAPTLARLFLDTVVRQHGMPECIISDRDPRFTAHFWRAFWTSMGTTLSLSTAYHPQTDGQTENANKTLEIMLRSVIDFSQNDWDEHLAAAELAINNSKSETTGFSPFYLFYGREARMPLDLALAPLTRAAEIDNPTAAEQTARWRRALAQAAENTRSTQVRQKKYADQTRRALQFAVGDRVLLSTEHLKLQGETKRARKLTERFIGPYRVKRVVNPNAYELELPSTLKIHPTINITQLKEYRDGAQAFPDRPIPITRPAPEATDDNGAPEWAVERILDSRKRGKRDQYLVLWRGYPLSEATWEPIEHMDGALDLVIEFNEGRSPALQTITASVPQSAWARPPRISTSPTRAA